MGLIQNFAFPVQKSPVMTRAPLAAFPANRPRRLRQADWIRRLVRETSLSPSDLIWSIVVHEGEEAEIPVASMPGAPRLSVKRAAEVALEAKALGIPAIAVFPHVDPAKKDARGSDALNPDNVVCRAVKAMKAAAPDVGIMCDVALDPFTSHGHDGLIENGRILNDETVEALVAQGLVQSRAGCDILAPSDMMDGRVGALRSALEAEACAIRPDPAPPWFTVESPRFRGRFAACRLGPSEHPGSSAMALALGKSGYPGISRYRFRRLGS